MSVFDYRDELPEGKGTSGDPKEDFNFGNTRDTIKKYLIIESCKACPLRLYDHSNNRFYCNEKNLTVPYHGVGKRRRGFPTWCPLDNVDKRK